MSFNGNGNGCGDHRLNVQWKIGLVNSQNKYLTAETFGFKINASGTSLKKKQTWTLEQDEKEDVVYLVSHLGRYLMGEKKGSVTCSAETKEEETKFIVEYSKDNTGRWGFKNKVHGYYFGGTEDNLLCYEKQAGQTEWWRIHLATHPQANLRNVNRKKYMRYSAESNRLQCDKITPWGPDCLITLEYIEGKYAFKSCNGQILHCEGSLVEQPSQETLFAIELRSGQMAGMAFRDSTGKYLTAVGVDGLMQSRSKTVNKDELFTIEDNHPQVEFTSLVNKKKASIKQGVDVSANQSELTDTETFQVEYDKKSSQWRIKACNNKYWSLQHACGIQAVANNTGADGLFTVEWTAEGYITIKASNGRYVGAKMNGSLYADSDTVTDKCKFHVTITNRPLIVLKCEFGFVGFKTATNARIECSKAIYDVFSLEHTDGENAVYYLKGSNGKYWCVDKDGFISAESASTQAFYMELCGQSKCVLRAASNGCYLKGEQNGIVTAKSQDRATATAWEY